MHDRFAYHVKGPFSQLKGRQVYNNSNFMFFTVRGKKIKEQIDLKRLKTNERIKKNRLIKCKLKIKESNIEKNYNKNI